MTDEPLIPGATNAERRASIERVARIAQVLVRAAFANTYVREYLRDLTPAHGIYGLWTTEGVQKDPPVRLEFEHAYALGGIGECLAACENKPSFGKLIGVLPVEPDDPVGETRIMYVYKDSSPYNRRVLQRKWMKHQLGRGWRRLVGLAMANSKGDFLKRYVDADARHMIRLCFGKDMDAGRFWRVARGKEFIEVPKPPLQKGLFDDEVPDHAA